jgi:hypothetical protein
MTALFELRSSVSRSWVRRSMRAWETINIVAWVAFYLAYRIFGR